jgi:hypothetical protein
LFKKSTKISTRDRTFQYNNNIYEKVKSNFKYHSDCQTGIVTAMSLIMENLIYRKNLKDYKYFLISLNPNDYTQQNKDSLYYKFNITYHDLIHAIEVLKYCGIISHIKGGRQYRKLSTDTEWRYDYKTARLTSLYLNPINQWIPEINLSALDKMRILSYYKEEENKSTAIIRYKDDKKNILYEKSIQDKKLQKINEWLVDNNYEDLQYQRIYSTQIDSTEIGYGRVFNTFQQISKEDRQTICEELQLREFDFKSCLINILYTLETSRMYEGDIYNDTMDLFGITEELQFYYRDIFKKIFIILLNCEKRKAKKAINQVLKENNLLHLLSSQKVIDTITQSFPILNKYFFTNSSSISQFLESEICISIMSIMINDNILPISIHDSFYFPTNDYEYYSNLCFSIFYNIIFNYKSYNQKLETINFNYKYSINLFNNKNNYSLLNNIIIKLNKGQRGINFINDFG